MDNSHLGQQTSASSPMSPFEEPKKFSATSPISQSTGAGHQCDDSVVVVHETSETLTAKESDAKKPTETNTNIKVNMLFEMVFYITLFDTSFKICEG